MLKILLALFAVLIAGARALAADAVSPADAEFFERDIRPLLIQRCYKCHGEIKEPKGGLSLASREAVLLGGESGPAAVAAKPAESLLISAINYDGLEMPPEGDRLSAAEIAKLTTWVERGLPWPVADEQSLKRARSIAETETVRHAQKTLWSLKPMTNPPLPEVRDAGWSRTPIDRFLLVEMEKRGLAPSPAADRRTLLRRLSFDLVGLPPTPEEVDAFMADSSPQAIEHVVDRLLASPHYGERWGRHWLDVARYADTKGYVFVEDGNFPWSYTYRDYVVRALNNDLPYDRFLVEQLAADQLPLGDDKRPLTALGFLTLGSSFMNNQQDVIDDRIDVVTRGLLGLTVTCARCHDHKFDAISMKDYYALHGVFASCAEPTVPPLFEPPPQTEAYAAFAKELTEREHKLTAFLDGKYAELIETSRGRVAEYLLAAQAQIGKPATEGFMLLADGNDLNPTMLIRYQAYLEATAKQPSSIWAVWHALAALPADKFAAESPTVLETLLTKPSSERPIHPLVLAAFRGRAVSSLDEAAKIYGDLLVGAHRLWQGNVQVARATGNAAPAALENADLESLRQELYGPQAPASIPHNEISELALLPDRGSQGMRTDLRLAIEQWRASGPAAPPRAMVTQDLPKPVTPRVFLRGNPSNLGDEVPRRFMRVLCEDEPQPFVQGSGRLELAQAIANPRNPLTARVIVNRVWREHFGAGLVATPSDFGARSQPPTHPELLDHLAWNFMEHGWSLKWLHREIVLSAAYAQTSDEQPACRAIDSENVYLWKMNRRRLDFEATRDGLLLVSGRLDRTLGGPPAPDISEPTFVRRTLYAKIDRLNLPGLFRTFDFPSPDATSPERSLTTIPQQALFFLNSPLAIESAKGLLARGDVAGQSDAAPRIERMYKVVFARAPAADELRAAEQFVREAPAAEAAWQELAQALLVSNEFLYVD